MNRAATRRVIPLVPARLTPREREILYLISNGNARKAIAQRLYISESTVQSHCRDMYSKLGAHDRAHAVAIAFRMGILPAEDMEERFSI